MGKVLEISQSEFEEKAVQAEGLVLVDFSAPWCGPCRRLEPELEAAAAEFEGKATVLKVNVDNAPEIATRYGVQGIPNITFLKGGQMVDQAIGLMPKSAIVARIKQNL